MATTYEWNEARQCMVPVSTHSIENQPLTAEAEPKANDDEAVKAAKAAIAEAKRQLAKAQGKEPGRRGKAPLAFEATAIGGNVDKAKLAAFKAYYPGKTNTEYLRMILDMALEHAEAVETANAEQAANLDDLGAD